MYLNPLSDFTVKKFKGKKIIALCKSKDFKGGNSLKLQLIEAVLSKNPKFKIASFSSPLINAVAQIHNLNYIDIISNQSEYEPTIRAIAKHYKKKDPQFFVTKLLERIIFDEYVIITDVKFSEQYHFLKKCNALIVEIKSDEREDRDFEQNLINEVENPSVIINGKLTDKNIKDLYFNMKSKFKVKKIFKRKRITKDKK